MATANISPQSARRFIERFRKLDAQRVKVDYETAGLATEIRDCFPRGSSGDYQFRQWCISNLDVLAPTAAMLLDAARSFRLFPQEQEWHDIGGWPTVRFLLGLTKPGRRKVLRAARAFVAEQGRPVSLSKVRDLAFGLGVRTARSGGRPTRTVSEENVGVLRAFIIQLYREYELPPLPASVKRALTPTKLNQIGAAAQSED